MNLSDPLTHPVTRTGVINVNIHPVDYVYIGRPMKTYGDGYFGNYASSGAEFRKSKSQTLARVKALRGFLHYFRHRMGLVWNVQWSRVMVRNRAGELIRCSGTDDEYQNAVRDLRGRNLGCFCLPALCHGHIYAAWLDGGPVGLARVEAQIRALEAAVER